MYQKINMTELSIVIPCYNEEKNMASVIERFAKLRQRHQIELITVDNGSTDNTGEVLRKLTHINSFVKVVSIEKNIGYGHGIMAGLKEASGEVVSWTHADLQTDPEDILVAYDTYKKSGGDVVIKGKRKGRDFLDVAFTFLMSVATTLILQRKVSDINAQPKMFSRNFLALMKNPPDDFSLDVYCLYVAKQNNIPIIEIPVAFRKRKHGVSKSAPNILKKVQFSISTLIAIIRMRFRKN